ncbi:MAG: hypothetical protein CR966_01730 [Pseudomonadales bacterium]|nr:MAG: hypothetical protein CR966_01730 [Pseudomonadales bacterium]
MKKLTILPLLSVSLLLSLTACQNAENNLDKSLETQSSTRNSNNQQTAITEDHTSDSEINSKIDNDPMVKIDFPQLIDDIPYLLHPIVPTTALENKASKNSFISKGGYEEVNFFYESSPYHYQTHINNLIFENLKTSKNTQLFKHNNFVIKSIFYPYIPKKQLITNKQMAKINGQAINGQVINGQAVEIQTVDGQAVEGEIIEGQIAEGRTLNAQLTDESIEKTLQELTTNTAKHKLTDLSNLEIKITPKQMLKHFIYQVNEQADAKPENKKSNLHKQLVLYMSDENGENLNKLHPDDQYLSDTKWMPTLKRFYFITQSDSDGNGIIDNKDKYHNYLIDFNAEKPTVKSYSF